MLAFLLLGGCGSDAPPYVPPVEVKVVLVPGQRVVCENSSARIGIPTTGPSTSIILWMRHRFVCQVEAA